ncbi:type IV toxin-antitoxin system AbiEi family antitoxin domain-containing protein [Acidipropionibacterium timonense]|uniref:type IV toxin-antitoxin system AbiEi family antitoxin domain-containing protein n=1 Tax=Acidipropionibacterium timonense TaxID=2161818 RepID=UPI001030EBEA|nr:type IV toxin-antitoxin system AbiEi family antitoxin domain-containing protein [Acidipropionibacterium timonense]
MTALKDYARTVDLAARQDGVVTRQQLLRYGINPSSIPRMLADDTILAVAQRGVYYVPALFDTMHGWHRVIWESLEPAMFTQEKLNDPIPVGVFSHYTAAEFHGAWDLPMESHLTRPTSRHVQRYTVHVDRLSPDDMCWIDGLPVTTLERTTYDLGHMRLMDGEHRSRWMLELVEEHGWTIDRVCEVMGPDAVKESLPYYLEKVA